MKWFEGPPCGIVDVVVVSTPKSRTTTGSLEDGWIGRNSQTWEIGSNTGDGLTT
jgi:hypothetical protein